MGRVCLTISKKSVSLSGQFLPFLATPTLQILPDVCREFHQKSFVCRHGVEQIYAVSYLWYPTVGIVLVMFMGIITSCIPGQFRVPLWM